MSLPFANLVFCSTSLDPSIKKGLLTKIQALGGKHLTDLTSDVNVLVVGERFTNKYVYCVNKRPDIKFMSPKAIADAYEKWLNMDDEDTYSFKLDDFLMPVFEGVNICLSRINNDQHIRTDQTHEIADLIQKNGGKADITLHSSFDCVVTNERSGKRYNKAKEWKIKTIHPLWVLHSVERGAMFPWNCYDIDAVSEEAKIGEESLAVINELSMLKDITDVPLIDAGSKSMLTLAPSKKKSRLWSTIMDDTEDSNGSKKKKVSEWDEDQDGDDDPTTASMPLNSAKQYASVLDPQLKLKPASRVQLSASVNPPLLQRQQTTTPMSTLFAGLTFNMLYFDSKKTEILSKTIRSHSGEISTSETPSYLIIPHDFPINELPQSTRRLILSQTPHTKVVTEWFIERSLNYNEQRYDTWTKPFFKRMHIVKPTKLHVSISGFFGVELLHIKKLISLLPEYFEFSEYLNETKDLLIVNSDILHFKSSPDIELKYPDLILPVAKSEVELASATSIRKKAKYAKAHNIPLVRVSFVFDFFKNETNNLPVINGREWCLFVPRGENIKESLKDYIDNRYHNQASLSPPVPLPTSAPTSTLEPSATVPPPPPMFEKPQIPKHTTSPLRNSTSNVSRLLAGRAEVSQFDKIRSNNSSNASVGADGIITDENRDDDEFEGTQVNYQDDTPLSRKSRMNNMSNKPTKRTTRAGTKEVINILD
ncbi:hypothetical protein WICPIJ_005187 [Wickerhamomyces pijperi]|uniref:BRCT domain-containing protein n=1 Tax=Wickerhamomyces pijperi TaxID=599730 RepID=A0A9P8Q4B8_WICPI|nr:hypothetical protein WICPIJ_005187 [Wickerhamomyces pijperi]